MMRLCLFENVSLLRSCRPVEEVKQIGVFASLARIVTRIRAVTRIRVVFEYLNSLNVPRITRSTTFLH